MEVQNYIINLISDFEVEKFLGNIKIEKSSITDIIDTFENLESEDSEVNFISFIKDKNLEKKISSKLGCELISKEENFSSKPTEWIYLVKEIEGKIEVYYIFHYNFSLYS